MKRWQILSALLLGSAGLLFVVGQARADSFDDLVATVATVFVKSGSFLDGLMNYWVQGNSLTQPGHYLAGALAQTAVNVVHFFAVLVTMF